MTATFLRSFGFLPQIDSMDMRTLRSKARLAELVRLAGFITAASALCAFPFLVGRQQDAMGILLGLLCIIAYGGGLGITTVATVFTIALRPLRPDKRPFERWLADAFIGAGGLLSLFIAALGLWLALVSVLTLADAGGGASSTPVEFLINRTLFGIAMMGTLPFGMLFCLMGAAMHFPSVRSTMQSMPNHHSEISPGD